MDQTKTLENPAEEKVSDNLFNHKDILDAIAKQGREMPIGKDYDPVYFWNELGEEYFKKFNRRESFYVNVLWMIDRLKMLDVKTLLDVGTGFGRVLPFLLEEGVIEKATGLDAAPNILKSADAYLKPHEPTEEEKKKPDYKEPPDYRSKIEFLEADVRKIPLESETFDVVLVSEVLQHLEPEDLMDAVRECVRMARKAVVMVERWAFPSEHAEPHLWSHNISQVLKDLGVEVTQVTTIGQGLQGIVALKRRIE